MNATSPISLLGTVVGGAKAAPRQGEGRPEGPFVDSLAAALSGEAALVVPPVPVLPVQPDAGALGLTLVDATGLIAGRGGEQLGGPLLDQAGLTAGSITGRPAFPINPQVLPPAGADGQLQGLTPSLRTTETSIAASQWTDLSTRAQPFTPVAPTSVPGATVPSAGGLDATASTGRHGQSLTQDQALLAAGSKPTSSDVSIVSNLEQMQTTRTDRQAASDQASLAVRQQGGHAVSAQAMATPAPTEKSRPAASTSPSTAATPSGQISPDRLDTAASLPTMAESLLEARATAKTANAALDVAKGPAKPVSLSTAQAAPGDNLPLAGEHQLVEAADTFQSEISRLEPGGTAMSKPSSQAAPPPGAQIALQIARLIPQGIDRMQMQLHPAELGHVSIQLDFADDGRVSALITAERPDALGMLQRDSRVLERSLSDAGIRLENNGLNFSLRQDQQQQGQGFNPSADRHSQAYQTNRDRDGSAETELSPALARTANVRLLDIST